jgi:glycosyltransferase involved in cell wall biosynthesis
MRLALIIPTFDEGERLPTLLARLHKVAATGSLGPEAEVHAVVVDDCSSPPVVLTPVGSESAPEPGSEPTPRRVRLHLLRHAVNLGQGAAIQTGVTFARDVLRADEFVTLDADGQHAPEELPALLSALRAGAEVVFGNRFANGPPAGMPMTRRLLLRAAAVFEARLTGLRLHDAHHGYRAFGRRFAAALDLQQNRMAHATEFKQVAARLGATVVETPLSMVYSPATLAKGQRDSGSLVILKDLLASYLFGR